MRPGAGEPESPSQRVPVVVHKGIFESPEALRERRRRRRALTNRLRAMLRLMRLSKERHDLDEGTPGAAQLALVALSTRAILGRRRDLELRVRRMEQEAEELAASRLALRQRCELLSFAVRQQAVRSGPVTDSRLRRMAAIVQELDDGRIFDFPEAALSRELIDGIAPRPRRGPRPRTPDWVRDLPGLWAAAKGRLTPIRLRTELEARGVSVSLRQADSVLESLARLNALISSNLPYFRRSLRLYRRMLRNRLGKPSVDRARFLEPPFSSAMPEWIRVCPQVSTAPFPEDLKRAAIAIVLRNCKAPSSQI